MADVVCHEVAHQWFGNLVTTATWQDLTVNEARTLLRATFIGIRAHMCWSADLTHCGRHMCRRHGQRSHLLYT